MLNADELVSTGFLADLLGISKQAIARLARTGVLSKASRGLFPLGESVRSYLDFKVAGEAARRGTGSSDRVRDARATEIELRIAREERKLITMDECNGCLDQVVGGFITMLSVLPAQITKDIRERQRIETIIDAGRQRLSDKFDEMSNNLRAGLPDDEPDDEEDS
ncbi:hypothetical protein X773_01165 [Mesorhizobium sp. LSJC285A00]|uniref:hypothetical protein n=1 Tax=unclassified Mesorhizobium TaxID=325217 RepID=UPI0003CF9155|nr:MULTISPECIES: hypothetical protein [unclassified Mesorhizobium]ESW91716.1 hypothetical protein X773_01165 [Mesorhizobium sp. LSJC285A00]ESZ46249.1 hypothetical protein X731_16320 [Mesorhizobium sp. L2C054A000]RUW92052.1 hypothetical protein EOA19_11775 [Mesorhizobium sp. M7A.F.Ca.US.010.02.1.1]